MNRIPFKLTVARLVLLSALGALATQAPAQIVRNGSFETPVLPANSFDPQPSGASWTFSIGSGILNGMNSAIGLSSPPPSGAQAAYLSTDNPDEPGNFFQTITLPSTDVYTLSFFDAGRNNDGGTLFYDVFLDSEQIFSSNTVFAQPFTLKTTTFTGTAGSHTLTFRNNAATIGSNTAAFDSVSIVPEPGTLALLSMGLLPLAAVLRRRYKR